MCPRPLNSTICLAFSIPSFVLLDFNTANTGDSFSRVSGSLTPTSLHSAAKITVPLGTSNPANLAISVAGLPTITEFNLAPAQFSEFASTPNNKFSNLAFSSLVTKCTRCDFMILTNSSYNSLSTIAACSLAQIIPLSNALLNTMSLTACLSLASL